MSKEALLAAISAGDLSATKDILDGEPALLEFPIDFDDRALHIACWEQHPAIVSFLLRRGSDPNSRGDHHRPPLYYAIDGQQHASEIVDILLAAGADPNTFDDCGISPLDHAMYLELRAVVSRLMAHGTAMTPFAAILRGDPQEIRNALRRWGDRISDLNLKGLVSVYVQTGEHAIVEVLEEELRRRKGGLTR